MTTENFIKDNPQYFEDELDKWLYREFDILGGAQSSTESMKYHVAREVAEKAMEYARQQPVSDDLEEAATVYARKDSKGIENPTNFYYVVADKSRIFKDGANWQLTKLMKDAVDGICISNGKQCGATIESLAGTLFLQYNRFDVGDKVKLIILKD